ncbi:MAG: HEAT repeat domain-containing protein [Gammaproteobacteria bacterium]
MAKLKLDDEQVRRFICDGVLPIDSVDDDDLHQHIRDKLAALNERPGHIDSNVLPSVSELQRILDAPAVDGALTSILGDDYMLHPMKAVVPSAPLAEADRKLDLQGDEDGPPMGEGSRSYSYWHKDTYSPLGRARYQVPRFVFLFYFPQDTPKEMGPTRVIPGSQYQDRLSSEDHPFAYVPEGIRAGNCLLTAYDIDHAGLSNRTEQMRYMVKFIFFRTRNPQRPSWNGGEGEWQVPEKRLGRYEHTETWTRVWDWMRGNRQEQTLPANDVGQLVSRLNSADQQQRLAALYSLGAMGKPALEPLMESLLEVEGHDRIEPPYVQNADGSFEARGNPDERHWTEGGYIFQDEAYALGCLGEIAIDPLLALLEHEDPWIVVNAAFALGETGAAAGRAVPRLAQLLESPDHRVVRIVLEAIACISSNTIAALPAIRTLLETPRDAWHQDIKLDDLVGDQIHFNAVYALLLSDLDIQDIEGLLIDLLQKPAPNVCVPATALEILLRRGSPEGMRHAVTYLKAHRWDDYG